MTPPLLLLLLLLSLRPSWAGGRCPSECFCLPSTEAKSVEAAKSGRSARELRTLIHDAPAGAPILVHYLDELVTTRTLTQSHLVLLERSAASDANVARLRAKPSKITILHNAPISIAEAETIHTSRKGHITNVHLAEIRSDLASIASISVDARTLPGTSLRAKVLEHVQHAKSEELVVVIAHQEDGALRFSDASHVLAEELERDGGPMVWVIACNTLQQARATHGPVIGIGSRLTYAQAMQIAARIHKAAAGGQSYHSILLKMQHSSPVIVAVVGALIFLSFTDDEESL